MHLSLPCPTNTSGACYCRQLSIRFRPVNVIILKGCGQLSLKVIRRRKANVMSPRSKCATEILPVAALKPNRRAKPASSADDERLALLLPIPSLPIPCGSPPRWCHSDRLRFYRDALPYFPDDTYRRLPTFCRRSIVFSCSCSCPFMLPGVWRAAAGIGCNHYHLYGCGAKSRVPFAVVRRTIFCGVVNTEVG
jgi:hypothetical protein